MTRTRDVTVAAALALVLAGCTFVSSGPTSATHSAGRAPRTDAVLEQASRELPCPVQDLRVVLETRRRYANETAFRFVIEGCGQRLGYVEECDLVGEPTPPGWRQVDGSLACRDVLVTRLDLREPNRRASSPAASTRAPTTTEERAFAALRASGRRVLFLDRCTANPSRGCVPRAWSDADAVLLRLDAPHTRGGSELLDGVEIDWASPGIDGRLVLRVSDEQMTLRSGHDNPHENRLYWVAPSTPEQHAAVRALVAKPGSIRDVRCETEGDRRDCRFAGRVEKTAFGDDHVPVVRANARTLVANLNRALPRGVEPLTNPASEDVAPRPLVSPMAEEIADWLHVADAP